LGRAAHAIRSSQPESIAARRVSALRPRSAIRCSTSASFRSAPVPGGVEQLGDLVQGEPEPLRGPDHPEHGDRLVRVEPMPTEAALRLRQQSATLVVPQRLPVHPGRSGDLPRP